jgi:glycosyltransferase involved in cell wall biosynthesis
MMLSVLIATQNRSSVVGRAIRSAETLTYPNVEIIVVDDASTDDTQAVLATQFPHVRVVRNDRSLGVGGARAVGLDAAHGDILVSLDDDAYFLGEDAGERIAERFESMPDLGALCFQVEAPDGSIRQREIPRRDKRMPTENEELGYFLGGAAALRILALREVGGFPADTRYAAEEADISFRLAAAGYRVRFTSSVRVAHEAIPSTTNTEDREANYVRSHIRLAARYLPAPYAQTHAALWIGKSLLQATRTGHLATAWEAARATLGEWRSLRQEGRMLNRATVRRLTALSSRTWY